MKNFTTRLFAAALLATPVLGHSSVITVDTVDDVQSEDGRCSQREAIENANNSDHSGSVDCQRGAAGADTITFDASLVGGVGAFPVPADNPAPVTSALTRTRATTRSSRIVTKEKTKR